MYGDLFNKKPWNAGLDGTVCGQSTSNGSLRQQFLTAAQNYDFFDKVILIVNLNS